MPLARCPKCGRTFPNTLRECPGCGYSPFVRPEAPKQPPLSPKLEPMPVPELGGEPLPPQESAPAPAPKPSPAAEPVAAVEPDTDDEEEGGTPFYRRAVFWIIVGVLILGALAAVFLLPKLRGESGGSVTCSHIWLDADCENPKTCSICGATEGEPLGHDFHDNVCSVCGAFEKPFIVYDMSFARNGDHFVFTGKVQNCTGGSVKNVKIKLEFLDRDRKVVETDWTYAAQQEALSALDVAQWTFAYNHPYLNASYCRATVTDFEVG